MTADPVVVLALLSIAFFAGLAVGGLLIFRAVMDEFDAYDAELDALRKLP